MSRARLLLTIAWVAALLSYGGGMYGFARALEQPAPNTTHIR